MKRIGFLFLILLFTTSQTIAGLDEDLVFYFTFDKVKHNRILDESRNQFEAHVAANIDFIKGKYGSAIHINAEAQGDDCLNIPADDLLKIEDEITMMVWMYHEDWSTASGYLFTNGDNIDLARKEKTYSLGLFPDLIPVDLEGPDIQMVLGTFNTAWTFLTWGALVGKRWHHIAGVYDGRTARIYLDGKILSDNKKKFEFKGVNDSSLQIGCAKHHPGYTFKNGAIDEAGLWRRGLTQTEIEEAMNGIFAVLPIDKVTTTWGNIKRGAVAFK